MTILFIFMITGAGAMLLTQTFREYRYSAIPFATRSANISSLTLRPRVEDWLSSEATEPSRMFKGRL
jgi:hypothetical protein